jgi:hypothetical protein
MALIPKGSLLLRHGVPTVVPEGGQSNADSLMFRRTLLRDGCNTSKCFESQLPTSRLLLVAPENLFAQEVVSYAERGGSARFTGFGLRNLVL